MPNTQARKKASATLRDAYKNDHLRLLPDEKKALGRMLIRNIRRERRAGPPIFFDAPINARAKAIRDEIHNATSPKHFLVR
jgi:hypothetical protein